MKLLFFISAFILLAGGIRAQKITISGRAIDKETREPLAFASVWIRGKPVGTITNLQGEFDFHIPAEYRNEILVISMLSYESFEAPVWSLVARSLSVELVETTQMLQEVVVSDSLAIGDILRIALERIDDNVPREPYLMDGFYLDTKKLVRSYVFLLEAAIKI